MKGMTEVMRSYGLENYEFTKLNYITGYGRASVLFSLVFGIFMLHDFTVTGLCLRS